MVRQERFAGGLLVLFLVIGVLAILAWLQWSGTEKQKISQWREGYSQIRVGMSEEEVRSLMGNPTNESVARDPQRHEIKTLVYSWAPDKMFIVQMDADRKVEDKTETK